MRGSGPLWGLLNQARRLTLDDAGAPPPTPVHEGITRRRAIAALAGAAALPAIGWPAPSRARSAMRVAVIGGGLAGLIALDALSTAGVDAHLYEARGRLGGRVVSDESLIRDLRAIAVQIGSDAAALDADYAGVAPRLDALSVKAYLDRHSRLLKPHVRALIEATIRTEYGAEPGQTSALALMFNLPVVDGEAAELISLSDERFILKGGSSTVVRALSEPLMPRISTGHALASITQRDCGLDLRFANGKVDRVDRVIVTVPAPLMRTIDYGGLLSEGVAAMVREFECGRNEKINAGYTARVWEKHTGAAGAAWAVDTRGPGIYSEFWDASSGQPGDAGVLTWFFGGDQVDALMAAEPEVTLRRAEAAIAPAVPGLKARTMRRTAWCQDPYARGAYSTFKPGQLTRFAPYLWVEEAGVTQKAMAGPIVFAGEHMSDAFPGFMNGAAQTGRLAAKAVLAETRVSV